MGCQGCRLYRFSLKLNRGVPPASSPPQSLAYILKHTSQALSAECMPLWTSLLSIALTSLASITQGATSIGMMTAVNLTELAISYFTITQQWLIWK
jgi:hypothetical protein